MGVKISGGLGEAMDMVESVTVEPAVQDMVVSLPPLARSLEVSFEQYGSNMSLGAASKAVPMVVD